jgi:anti-sigma-K factor RskA
MADTPPLTDDDRAELVAYLDGELDATEAERVESRLRTDPRIRAEADAYQQTWALLDHLPQAEASPTFASRTLEQLSAVRTIHEPAGRRWPSLRSWAWAAGLIAAAGIGYAVTPNPRRTIDLDSDPVYLSDPRLIENLPLYLAAENLDYLQSLDSIDLFGEDAVGR